ncbi:hypothetical protein Leryth_019552 [Lithospermum erythrorhizon]|nr:hypothetical protein Leryth_019552 [Lithospermum erythrorhizon]
MDYESYDSSGTDDDLPPSHQNRFSRGGGHIAGNGRSSAMGSAPYAPRMYNKPNMEAQIHQLEQEAYSSVLRAFKAQADAITWENQELLTKLRKELRLSNEEYRELLGRVNTDEVICSIREWRQLRGPQQDMVNAGQPGHDPVPSPVSASRKKQKIVPLMPSQQFGGPSAFPPQSVAPTNQPLPSAPKRGHMTGPKGKKQKSYRSSGPSGRGQLGNRVSFGHFASELEEAATFNPLIGRKVRTRWPDDNNFYEAVITDYNAAEGRHALVYDMGTPNEAWEWVNLSEISPEDIHWVDEDPGISRHGGPGRGMNNHVGRAGGPGAGRGCRGLTKGHPVKDFPPSQNFMGRAPEDIKILCTDVLIKEVERILGVNHPDPLEIEKAKQGLKIYAGARRCTSRCDCTSGRYV